MAVSAEPLTASSAGMRANAPIQPAPSLDEQIKAVQLAKLQAELRHLNGFSAETAAKLAVTVLGILAAAWTFWVGVPQAKLDLYNAQEQRARTAEELNKKAAELAQKTAELRQADQRIETARSELDRRTADLADAQARTARALDEFSQLQAQIRSMQAAVTQLHASSADPAAQQLQKRLTEAAKPRLFVQFAGGLSRDNVIAPLLKTLAAQGFSVPGAERINRGQSNEVRYFTDSEAERTLAQSVAQATQKYFQDLGCPLPALKVKYMPLSEGRQSPLELWLMHNCDK